MKKIRYTCTIIFIIFSALFTISFCAGCEFIRYVENTDNSSVISEEIKQLQDDYVNKLYSATSQIEYREAEQRVFEYALQDAINELYECRSEEDLKEVYDKHLTVIGKIKTDKDYVEEANIVSAYRGAILSRAEESYDKRKYSAEQITYFDCVFEAFSERLFEITDMEEMNSLLQELFFGMHKEDEIATLIGYADITEYEDSEVDILMEVLDKCIDDIRSCEDECDIDDIKDIYILEVCKRDTVKKLKSYIDLRLYRDEQAVEIQLVLTEYIRLAEIAENSIDEANIFREFQIAVYNIPTAEMLYNNELAELKEMLFQSLVNTYKLSSYRDNESNIVRDALQAFEDVLPTIRNKEDVLSQYVATKDLLDAVKTANDLYAEELLDLIEELYDKMLDAIYKNIEQCDQAEYLSRASSVYSSMCDCVTKEGVRQAYRQFAYEIGVLDVYIDELVEYNESVIYREDELQQVVAIKQEYLARFEDDIPLDEAKAILLEAKNAIDEIKTNDDWWNEGVTQFRANLYSLYGDAILQEPSSLTEANDYYELAKIIDYYAFYQVSGAEFVCDTFRVKLNFDHGDAQTELLTVYWYCELLRTAVGITSYFEENSDYLVCHLIPYNFASVSNDRPIFTRQENAVTFDSDKADMTNRSVDFNDFPYYQYEREISVWNSQQLWYALENEYIPICVPNSPAEIVMNRAKEILRAIIMEGMSDEEKIYQIYTWFGKNGEYDYKYSGHFDLDDAELSDENICKLNSFHIEGALLDCLGVCYSYAKASLLLLRMEGIEAFYVYGNTSLSNMHYYAPGHSFNYIHLADNWYISDPLRSFYQTLNHNGMHEGLSYYYLLLPAINSYDNFYGQTIRVNSDLWETIEKDAYYTMEIYDSLRVSDLKIIFDDDSATDLVDLLATEYVGAFSVFCTPETLDTINEILIANGRYDYYIVASGKYIELYCKLLVD